MRAPLNKYHRGPSRFQTISRQFKQKLFSIVNRLQLFRLGLVHAFAQSLNGQLVDLAGVSLNHEHLDIEAQSWSADVGNI
jgi:hypothetical protein